ncbi:hypothetical protein PCCS19_34230 [Paenibacillus sp. CCS19]|nr:hypothetical protein PCCS19_34230 [Paenibacillus cellulosilyticus]
MKESDGTPGPKRIGYGQAVRSVINRLNKRGLGRYVVFNNKAAGYITAAKYQIDCEMP